MDGFAIPLVLFAAGLTWLLLAIIRGSFDDPYPLRAGVTWAVTCPAAGLLFGIGAAPLALVVGAVSMLALGSLGYWFLATEADDTDDDAEHALEPDPGPSDDDAIEIPAWARRAEPEPEPKSEIDWDAFDRLREEWEKEIPLPVTEPERERVPAGV
ncbi:MAG: hypothetical protein ACLGI5_13805 [Thermoleophilia bacterium]